MPRSWNAKAMKHVAHSPLLSLGSLSCRGGRGRVDAQGQKPGVGRAAKTLLRVYIATAQQL